MSGRANGTMGVCRAAGRALVAVLVALWSGVLPTIAHAAAGAEAAGSGQAGAASGHGGETPEIIEEMFGGTAEWMLATVGDTPVWRIAFAILTIVVVLGIRRPLTALLNRWLRKLTSRTANKIDDALMDAVNPPFGWFVAVFGIYLGLRWLNLTPGTEEFIAQLYRAATIVIVANAAFRSARILETLFEDLASRTRTTVDDHIVPLLVRFLRTTIIALAVVFVIQQFGYNVASILAGLGIGGLAFAFAAKDTIANWFGAIMIFTDQPFEIGDWIKTGEFEGVVEEIGLRSTRIRTFGKSLVAVPNSTLANDTVENFTRMTKRRVSMKIGVTYSTTPAMMRESLERLRDMLRGHPEVDQEFFLVKFTEFGDSHLEILLYYFTTTTDWERFLSIREELNLRMMELLEEIGVEFAFPSRSVYMEEPDPALRTELNENAQRLLAARSPREDERESQMAPSDAEADG